MRKEKVTQNRIIKLLKEQLGYNYLGNYEERDDNSNFEIDLLKAFLQQKGYSDILINKAIFEFKKQIALSSNEDLYPVNKAVYSLLRYGVKVREEAGENVQTVHLIDWESASNNNFYIAEEVTIKNEKVKRPDVVLYVNGIALAVLELKRASMSASLGIRQNLDNQQHRFIKPFFTTIQLVLAGNDSEGLYYGTTKTSEKYFLKWKEDNYEYDTDKNLLDQHITQLCNKERLLDVIHNFIVFDGGIKKLCRPNQYFGIKESQKYIQRKQGGIIWHTQGSGKSLTMVWLAKWIRENVKDARLLIITDRTELDEQIERVFTGVDEAIYRTTSGSDLVNKLNVSTPWLICTLIHKFGGKEEIDSKNFIDDLKSSKNFNPKGNLFIFIDECHRTQSGELHTAMKDILPDALFIGFTGTPLLKKDKKKSIEIFGPYIHTYKFDEAVSDGVVLDLLYEARDVDQHVLDQKGIDEWFDAVTKGMNDLPKAELKQKWGTIQKVLSTKSRLEKIAFDVIKDFKIKPRLREGNGNAILVARSIYEACRYYEIFQNFGFRKCAIITSFEPSINSIKGEETGEGETEKIEQYEIYQKMLNGKDRATFEKYAKKQFVEEPANMQLLIVVDKLLTGFDAPSCTYLYIDKQMQDHGLFQAICRVNRTEDDKEFGFVVDYKNLFDSLDKSIKDYTSNAFDLFDESDVQSLLVDRLEKSKERLEDALETLHQLCVPVESPKQIEQYIKYFCGNTQVPSALKETEELRLTFYKAVVSLIRAYNNIASEMEEAGYTKQQAEKIKFKVDDYTELRNSIKNASGDYIDLKKYEPDMRQLLDMYLTADPSRTLSNFGDATLLQLIVDNGILAGTASLPKQIKSSPTAMAETIEANMRKVIIQEMPINPAYYEKMSTLLTELVRLRKEAVVDYEDYLKEIEKLANQIQPKSKKSNYPTSIDNRAKQALYDNLEENEGLANELYCKIDEERPDNWKSSKMKEKIVRNVVCEVLEKYGYSNNEEVDKIIEIAKNQQEFE